jgi:hypothetical protein
MNSVKPRGNTVKIAQWLAVVIDRQNANAINSDHTDSVGDRPKSNGTQMTRMTRINADSKQK